MNIGNKDELVQTIKDMHIDFIIFLSRKLTPSDFEFVDGIFLRDVNVPAIANQIVVAVKIPDPFFSQRLFKYQRYSFTSSNQLSHYQFN